MTIISCAAAMQSVAAETHSPQKACGSYSEAAFFFPSRNFKTHPHLPLSLPLRMLPERLVSSCPPCACSTGPKETLVLLTWGGRALLTTEYHGGLDWSLLQDTALEAQPLVERANPAWDLCVVLSPPALLVFLEVGRQIPGIPSPTQPILRSAQGGLLGSCLSSEQVTVSISI